MTCDNIESHGHYLGYHNRPSKSHTGRAIENNTGNSLYLWEKQNGSGVCIKHVIEFFKCAANIIWLIVSNLVSWHCECLQVPALTWHWADNTFMSKDGKTAWSSNRQSPLPVELLYSYEKRPTPDALHKKLRNLILLRYLVSKNLLIRYLDHPSSLLIRRRTELAAAVTVVLKPGCAFPAMFLASQKTMGPDKHAP